MRMGFFWGGGCYTCSLCTNFIHRLFISQVDEVQGNCDTLSQGLEHREVSCFM